MYESVLCGLVWFGLAEVCIRGPTEVGLIEVGAAMKVTRSLWKALERPCKKQHEGRNKPREERPDEKALALGMAEAVCSLPMILEHGSPYPIHGPFSVPFPCLEN